MGHGLGYVMLGFDDIGLSIGCGGLPAVFICSFMGRGNVAQHLTAPGVNRITAGGFTSNTRLGSRATKSPVRYADAAGAYAVAVRVQ